MIMKSNDQSIKLLEVFGNSQRSISIGCIVGTYAELVAFLIRASLRWAGRPFRTSYDWIRRLLWCRHQVTLNWWIIHHNLNWKCQSKTKFYSKILKHSMIQIMRTISDDRPQRKMLLLMRSLISREIGDRTAWSRRRIFRGRSVLQQLLPWREVV